MMKSIRNKVFSVGVCLSLCASAWGQKDENKAKQPRTSIDVGLTYAAERAYIAPGNCGCFWFNGGGADVAVTLWKGFGVAAALNGDRASNVTPGVDISKIAYLAGPRYTYRFLTLKMHKESKLRAQFFGEGLFGGAHAFNSAFPSTAGLKSSANSYAMQIGGGVNLFISERFAVRVPEVDYVRTALPNGASDVQNDLRLGFGVTYHIR